MHPSPYGLHRCGWFGIAMLLLMPAGAAAQDRYYVWIFSSQSVPKLPRYTHTWATFVQVSGADSPASFEAFTISWMPATLEIRFYRLRSQQGVNLDLLATLDMARSQNQRISLWGPYAIGQDLFCQAAERKDRLESGQVRYRAVDSIRRNADISACTHAVSDLGPGSSRLSYGWAALFGQSGGFCIAHSLQRHGLTAPPCEDLGWIEQALGIADPAILRRRH
jgi:hypothetical protein